MEEMIHNVYVFLMREIDFQITIATLTVLATIQFICYLKTCN